MPTIETAAVTAAVYAALHAAHMVGDHITQGHRDAEAKAAPRLGQLAAGVHPWTGWPACLRHVASYTTTQAAALLLVGLTVVPLGAAGAVAALTASAATHTVIDRRWIVRRIIQAKAAHEWPQGPYAIDQSLHTAALLVAAVLAATAGPAAAAATIAAGAALVGAALVVERRAAMAPARPVDPTRM
jgi:hypothetical protein